MKGAKKRFEEHEKVEGWSYSHRSKSKAELLKDIVKLEEHLKRRKRKQVNPRVKEVKIDNQDLILKFDKMFEAMQKEKYIENSPESEGDESKKESLSDSSSEDEESSSSSKDEASIKAKEFVQYETSDSSETSKSTKEDVSCNNSKEELGQVQEPDDLFLTDVCEENQAVMQETKKMLDKADKILYVTQDIESLEEKSLTKVDVNTNAEKAKIFKETEAYEDIIDKKENQQKTVNGRWDLEDMIKKEQLNEKLVYIEQAIQTTTVRFHNFISRSSF